MQRIAKIDPDLLTGEPKKIFERWSPGGKPLNIVLIYFRNIELNRNWSYMATHLFMKNSLSDRQREIVVLRTSWQCASDYEFIQHVRIAREGGLLSDDEISDLIKPEPALQWTEPEQALIDAADELLADNAIRDTTWATLTRHFDERQLMDVVATAGGYTLNSMATSSFDIDIEENMTREEGLVPSWNGPASRFGKSAGTETPLRVARIPPAATHTLEGKAAALAAPYLERGERKGLLETLAHYPEIVRGWMPIIGYVDYENTLAPAERAIIALRTASRCKSNTELLDRAAAARQVGVAADVADRLASAGPATDSASREVLLVHAVDELIDDMVISDSVWNRMSSRFGDEEIMDVVFATATQLMICWMQNALGIQPEAGS